MISETCWCLWRFVRPGHYDGACRHRPIAPELFPFQATCALKRKVFPRFWLRDDIARKAAQMIGQVGTGTPLVLVCLALLRSSAGRRRLNKKREKKKPPGMGRRAAKPPQKTRVRASRLCFRRGIAAQCEGEEACFRPRLGRGAAKEKKAAARRLLS